MIFQHVVWQRRNMRNTLCKCAVVKSDGAENVGGYGLERLFRYLLGCAVSFTFDIERGAYPYHARMRGLAAVVIAADAALYFAGKRRDRARLNLYSCRSAGDFFLPRIECCPVYNWLVRFLHRIHGKLAAIDLRPLAQAVGAESLLQKQISGVFLVAQHLADGVLMPRPAEAC